MQRDVSAGLDVSCAACCYADNMSIVGVTIDYGPFGKCMLGWQIGRAMLCVLCCAC